MPPATLNWRIASGAARRRRRRPIAWCSRSMRPASLRTRRSFPAAPGCFTLTLAATSTTSQSVAILARAPQRRSQRGVLRPRRVGRRRRQPRHSCGRCRWRPTSTPSRPTTRITCRCRCSSARAAGALFVPSDRAGAFDVARQSARSSTSRSARPKPAATGCVVHLLSADQPARRARTHTTRSPASPGCRRRGRSARCSGATRTPNQAQVIDDIAQIRTRHLATSGIWFDRPVRDGRRDVRLRPGQFDDPPAMLAALHAAGLRYGVWHTPYVAPARQRRSGRHAERVRDRADLLPADHRRAAEPLEQADRLHEPGRVRVVAAEPRELHAPRASRASSSTTARTSSPALGGARPVAVLRRQRRAHDALRLPAALSPRVSRAARSRRRVAAARTGRWGDQIARHDHLARRSRRVVRERRRHRPSGKTLVGGLPAALIEGHHAVGVGVSVLRVGHGRLSRVAGDAKSAGCAGSRRTRSRPR